jgi:hypothetical protein
LKDRLRVLDFTRYLSLFQEKKHSTGKKAFLPGKKILPGKKDFYREKKIFHEEKKHFSLLWGIMIKLTDVVDCSGNIA